MLGIKELRKSESGSALVDFAMTSLIFTVVMFGIVDLGRAAYAYSWVSNAARQGTRFAMVRGSNCSGLSRGCPAQASDVTSYLDTTASGIDTSQITVTAQCVKGLPPFPAPPCDPAVPVKVKVQYTFKFLSPLVPLSWNMQSVSQRVVQN